MYIVYISDHLGNPITQLFNISEIDVKLKLNDISSASLSISTLDENCKYEYFKEFNRVKICKNVWIIEKTVFDWICRWVTTNITDTIIDLNCRNFLLKKKILFVDKIYTNQTISNILQDLINDINWRDTWFINLNCDITEIVSRDYMKKKTLFDIIKDLAWTKYEFIFQDNNLIFTNTIWSDKSSWDNTVLFEFDINTPESRTIARAENSYDSDNIANSIISEDWEVLDNDSITSFWEIEVWFSTGKKADLIIERKDSIRELDIEPTISDFFICDLWDLVKVYINTWSDLMYYDSSLKVIEKNLKSWNLDTISIKLNTWKVKTLNLLETISNLKSRVSTLEL